MIENALLVQYSSTALAWGDSLVSGQIKFDPTQPHAFLSYTHADDSFLRDGITNLRDDLEEAVNVLFGCPLQIFQDVEHIATGDL